MTVHIFAFNSSMLNTAACCHAKYQLVSFKHMQAAKIMSQFIL